MNRYPIYPDYKLTIEGGIVDVSTDLRIKLLGRYYLVAVRGQMQHNPLKGLPTMITDIVMENIRRQAYRCMIAFPQTIKEEDLSNFILDPNQEDELDRINKLDYNN